MAEKVAWEQAVKHVSATLNRALYMEHGARGHLSVHVIKHADVESKCARAHVQTLHLKMAAMIVREATRM